MKKVLTIAGSDSSGGAGIQADLKTMTCLGVYGMSAITALTAQNTTGVSGVLEAAPEFVAQQLDCVFRDIRPDAVKIGMVSSADIIRAIGAKLREYRAEHIVVDPVMVATSGSSLMQDSALTALMEELFPLAEVITPNIPEAERLCGFAIEDEDAMLRAAEAIGSTLPGGVLVKGGHRSERRRRPAVAAGGGPLVPGRPGGQPQQPRLRLHPVLRHRLLPGPGVMTCPGRWGGPRPTSPPAWRPGWIWGRAAAR